MRVYVLLPYIRGLKGVLGIRKLIFCYNSYFATPQSESLSCLNMRLLPLSLREPVEGNTLSMKWVNHRVVSGMAVYMLTHDVVASLVTTATSVFPDWIEGEEFNSSIHRKISHWMLLYAVPAFLFFAYLYFSHRFISATAYFFVNFSALDTTQADLNDVYQRALSILFSDSDLSNPHLTNVNFILNLFFYALLGPVFHILEDALCGKVPFMSFKKRHGVRFFNVSSFKEYLFAASFVAVCVAFLYKGL